MTNKEAIKWLIRPTITTTGEAEGMQKKQLDAYYMAIEALLADTKAVYCWECKYQHECVQSIVIGGKNEIIHSCSYGERREP